MATASKRKGRARSCSDDDDGDDGDGGGSVSCSLITTATRALPLAITAVDAALDAALEFARMFDLTANTFTVFVHHPVTASSSLTSSSSVQQALFTPTILKDVVAVMNVDYACDVSDRIHTLTTGRAQLVLACAACAYESGESRTLLIDNQRWGTFTCMTRREATAAYCMGALCGARVVCLPSLVL